MVLCGLSDTVASPTAVLVVSLGMVNTKPFVAAACLAEVVIIEPDNVASIIRIADTFFIDVPPDLPADLKPAIVLNAFISLKSGDVKGSFDVELMLRPPSGEDHSFGSRPVLLEGGIHGANIRIRLDLRGIQLDKPYWLDALWGKEREVLTSIPFQFKRRTEQSTGSPDSAKTQETQRGVR